MAQTASATPLPTAVEPASAAGPLAGTVAMVAVGVVAVMARSEAEVGRHRGGQSDVINMAYRARFLQDHLQPDLTADGASLPYR